MAAVEPYRGEAESKRFVEVSGPYDEAPQGDSIDIAGLIAAFRRRLKLFLIVMGATLALVIVFLVVYPPEYTGTARVTVNARALSAQPEKETPIVAQLPAASADVDTEVQVIQSGRVTERVIDALRLDKDPEFSSDVIGLKGLIVQGVMKFFAPVVARSKRSEIIGAVQANLDPERFQETNAIDINFKDHDPRKAQKIANAFARAYLEDQVAAKGRQSQQAGRNLYAQLDDMRRQADSDAQKVQQYKIAHDLMSVGAQTLTEQEISNYDQGVAAAKVQAAEDLANLHTAQEQLARGSNGEDVGEALTSPVVTALRSQRASISAKLADMEGHYGPKYPNLAQARQELADIDQEIGAEIKRTISNLSAKTQVSQKRLTTLSGTLEATKGKLQANNAAMAELDALTRNASVSQELYEAYLQRYKQSLAQVASQFPDADIVSFATLPEFPSFPLAWLFLLLGVVAGGLFGCAAVLLAEMLDSGLASGDDVEQRLGRPYLGAIPLFKSVSRAGRLSPLDAAVIEPFSAYSEALRGLRAGIDYAFPGGAPGVVLITSSVPQEGKTTVAVGLARTAALQGVSTILVDGDARRRTLSRALKLDERRPGLIEVLAGEATLSDALVPDGASGARVLPMSGANRPGDHLMGGAAMDRLLTQLRAEATTVIIDTASLLPIAVTRVLATKADAVVLVTRWRVTKEDSIRLALRLLPREQVRLAGLVLNRIDVRKQAKFPRADAQPFFQRFNLNPG